MIQRRWAHKLRSLRQWAMSQSTMVSQINLNILVPNYKLSFFSGSRECIVSNITSAEGNGPS